MLAHKAEEEGATVAELIAGQANVLDHALIPNVVYTQPEIANVGLGEDEAKRQGRAVRIGRFPFAAIGRARAAGERDGAVKLIADAATDRLLGAAIIGPRASDLLAEVTAAMAFGGASEDLARTCHAHPTYSEAVKEAALACLGRAVHG
jgi:dihydrolipoamide dehydrogenase